jgi:hypothetical protein
MSTKPHLPASWLEACATWQREKNLSLRALARLLAKATDRQRPFDAASILRYLRGESYSEELTRAFAVLRGVATPAPTADAEPDVYEWCDLGHRLKREAPARFTRELEALRTMVQALEAHSTRHR